MENYIVVILITIALFFAMVVQLALKPRFAKRLNAILLILAAVGGFCFYGYGYTVTLKNIPLAIIHTLLSVCGTFVAKEHFSDISDAPLFQYEWVQVLFWLIHFCSFYATASTAITTIGAETLRKLRLWLARWGKLNLIYGVNRESIAFGQELLKQGGGAVVFIARKPGTDELAAISKAGAVVCSDGHALSADRTFFRTIGIRSGKRKVTLYALSKDAASNMQYARGFMTTAQKQGLSARQTALVLLGREDTEVAALQATAERYGFGAVSAFRESDLTARLLMQRFPPYETLAFDGAGCATEDFEALLIGFGQVGQAVLLQLVMNGQFAGSTFRAAVFAPDCQTADGFFSGEHTAMLAKYDITFHPYDGRGKELYTYLQERGEQLKYIAVCTGSEERNAEIGEELYYYFQRTKNTPPIYQCSHQGVKVTGTNRLINIYRPEILSTERIDRLAMILNHHYMGNGGVDPETDWMFCDHFSRMSNRASADFVGAMLRAAGRTEEEALADWNLPAHLLENLGKTEHLRWCAFHYCMGFSPMTEEEYDRRAAEYRRQVEAGEKPLRIGKNMEDRTHACLVDWEELDALSAKEQSITGTPKDYKALDIDNVLVLPKLLRAQNALDQ